MEKFKVIESPIYTQPDFPSIYLRVLKDLMKIAPEEIDKDWTSRFVHHAVKGLPIIGGKGIYRGIEGGQPIEEEMLHRIWRLITFTQKRMSQLTPRELTRIFPVTKDYSGHKIGCKDYFSTIEVLNRIGLDVPIGDQVDKLLFDYQNPHVIEFMVFKLGVCSDLRRYQGHPGLMEEFLAEKEVTPLHMMTDENGRQFLYDPAKQTTHTVMKRRPRYLKVIK